MVGDQWVCFNANSEQRQEEPSTRTGLITLTHLLPPTGCASVEDAEASGKPDADTHILQ